MRVETAGTRKAQRGPEEDTWENEGGSVGQRAERQLGGVGMRYSIRRASLR